MIARFFFFPLSEARATIFVAGLSMGGLGAFLQAMFRSGELCGGGESLFRRPRSQGADRTRPAKKPQRATPRRTDVRQELGYILGDLDAIEKHPTTCRTLAGRMALRRANGLEVPEFFACCGTEDFLV